MIRQLFMHFVDILHSNNDDMVVFGKWLTAWIVLSLPAYIPDVQEWVKFVSTIFGCLTAIIGFIVMVFRLIDYIQKRKTRNNG